MSGLANGGLFSIDAGVRRWRGMPRFAGHVAAVHRLPIGFLEEEYANGLAVVYGAIEGNSLHASVACHKSSGSLESMQNQWAINSLDDGGPYEDLLSAGSVSGYMGAQERGEFCYAVIHRLAPGTNRLDSEHLVRFNQSSYVESRFHQPWGSEIDVLYSTGGGSSYERFYPQWVFNPKAWNATLHVSDTYPPRLWAVEGNRVLYWVDSDNPEVNQQPAWLRWKRDGNAWSPPEPGPYRGRFQGAHYLQWYYSADEPWVRGPLLVRPWANSSLNPELWFIVRESSQRLRVYRSSWGPGNWKRQQTPYGWEKYNDGYFDIMDFGDGQYPQFNPHGHAFDHDWFKKDNVVGKIYGEPQDMDLMSADIKIVRDARRVGRLYMIVHNGGSSNLRSWWSMSVDDGANWGRFRRASGVPTQNVNWQGRAQSTVDPFGRIFAPGSSDFRSLICLNPNSGRPSDSGERPYVFRRAESRGSQWL